MWKEEPWTLEMALHRHVSWVHRPHGLMSSSILLGLLRSTGIWLADALPPWNVDDAWEADNLIWRQGCVWGLHAVGGGEGAGPDAAHCSALVSVCMTTWWGRVGSGTPGEGWRRGSPPSRLYLAPKALNPSVTQKQEGVQ